MHLQAVAATPSLRRPLRLVPKPLSKTSFSNKSCTKAFSAETLDGDAIETKLQKAVAAVILRQIRFRWTKALVRTLARPANDGRDSCLWTIGGHEDSLDSGDDVDMERMT